MAMSEVILVQQIHIYPCLKTRTFLAVQRDLGSKVIHYSRLTVGSVEGVEVVS
jgi:hypothetical protein